MILAISAPCHDAPYIVTSDRVVANDEFGCTTEYDGVCKQCRKSWHAIWRASKAAVDDKNDDIQPFDHVTWSEL